MNAEAQTSAPPVTASAEPRAERNPVPVWLFVVSFLLLYWGMVYFDQRGGWVNKDVYSPYRSYAELQTFQPVVAGGPAIEGFKVYNKPTCSACHQPDGKGTPGQFPPLVQSEWVLESEPGRIIRAVLDGLNGPITVKGQSFSGAMVPWRDTLDDEQIANVLSYVRKNHDWGHNAAIVTPDRVKAVREKTKGHKGVSWTADELLKVSPAD